MTDEFDLKEKLSTCFAAIYEDDGPNGICGQSCSITNPWKKLYIFETEERMREFLCNVEESKARKNSRVSSLFYPSELTINDINFIPN